MPKGEDKIKGHLTQISKHTQSTTTNRISGDNPTITDPIQEQHNVKTELVMATVEETHKYIHTPDGKILYHIESRKQICTYYVCILC